MEPKHILSAGQFDKDQLDALFEATEKIRFAMRGTTGRRILSGKHNGKIVATLFYEPSTRTRLSFESAAQRLGMGIISTENAAEFSSAVKGETIEDTIRVVATYADAIVMRHKETGAADLAAAVSKVPIINAGDGTGEHPTQALLDVFTIRHEVGRLDGLTVVVGGDLAHGRTARSLVRMLSIYNDNSFIFVSTPQLAMGQDILDMLDQRGIDYSVTDDIHNAVKDADVVYWTRLQKERLKDPKLVSQFIIDANVISHMKDKAIVMHPLPRINEITLDVDSDPRAAYFRQAENGLYIRMALLDNLF